MKLLILILLTITLNAQVGTESEVRFLIDPVVLLDEKNYNIKIELETGTYGDNRHRITVGAEILTGHDFYAVYGGYGYHIPYRVFNLNLSVQPGVNIGVIFRTLDNVDYFGTNHFFTLRHHLAIKDYFGLYITNRIIDRPDIRAQGSNQYYFIDNAVGIYFKL